MKGSRVKGLRIGESIRRIFWSFDDICPLGCYGSAFYFKEIGGGGGKGSVKFNGESSYPLKVNFKGPVYCTMDMSVP